MKNLVKIAEQIMDATDPTIIFGRVILKVSSSQKISDNMKTVTYLILHSDYK
jgi:hypothetical protein